MLCVLLFIGSMNGWSIPLRIAVAASAIVVLMDVVKQIKAIKKG